MHHGAVLAAASLACTLVLANPSAAHADTAIVSKSGLPSECSFSDRQPQDEGPGASSYAHVEGPAGVPSGLGSLLIATRIPSGEVVLDCGVGTRLASSLSTLTVTYKSDQPLQFRLGFSAPGFLYEPTVEAPPASAWTTIDLLGAAEILLLGQPHDEVYGRTTWPDLVASHPEATAGNVAIWPSPQGALTYVDTVRIGSSGDVTTFDFDTDPIPVITSSTMSVTLAPGGSTPLSGRVKRPSGDPIASLPVELWSMAYGSSSWVKASTVSTAVDGSFSTMVAPAARTSFQWRVAAPGFASATSASRTVFVRAVISVNVLDSTVVPTTSVVVFGKVRPTMVGTTATLRSNGRVAPLAYVKIRSDATFAFSRTLPRGLYGLYVTVPTAGGISGATSRTLQVRVS